MIARVWLPVQTSIGVRVFAAALLVAWCALATPLALLLVAAAMLGAIAVVAGSRDGADYAVSDGTGHLWLAGQFLLIGVAPNGVLFAEVLAGLVVGTLAILPWFARGSRPSATRTRASGRRPHWTVRCAGPAVALGVAASASGVPAGGIDVSEAAPWLIAAAIAWGAWRQQLADFLTVTLALAGGISVIVLTDAEVAPTAVGAALAAAAAGRSCLDRGTAPWVAWVATVPLCAAASALDPTALAAPFVVIFVVGLGAPFRAHRGRRRSVDRALHTLLPYDRWYGLAKLRADPLFDTLRDRDGLNGRVLDLGCGMALAGASKAAVSPGRYVGIDVDPAKLRAGALLLDAIGERASDSALWRGDVRADDVAAEERFDRVLLLDVLHYWPPADQCALLRIAASRLAQRGRLLVRDVVATDTTSGVESGERWTTFFGWNPRGAMHFATREEWLERFVRCGLAVESEHEFADGNVLFELVSPLAETN